MVCKYTQGLHCSLFRWLPAGPNLKNVLPVSHLDTKTWEDWVQVEKYWRYPSIILVYIVLTVDSLPNKVVFNKTLNQARLGQAVSQQKSLKANNEAVYSLIYSKVWKLVCS